MEKGIEKVALQMLGDGADIRMICQFTRLSIEEVKNLSQKSN